MQSRIARAAVTIVGFGGGAAASALLAFSTGPVAVVLLIVMDWFRTVSHPLPPPGGTATARCRRGPSAARRSVASYEDAGADSFDARERAHADGIGLTMVLGGPTLYLVGERAPS